MRTVLVFGASGAVGRYLLPLLDAHYKVSPVSRAPRPDWICADLNDTGITWPAADIAISTGPLDAFAAWLERQATPPRRVVALSSMSAQSKQDSPDRAERELAARLRASEARIFADGERRGITCTIFRPTLIYGAGTDRSLAPIARFAWRWHMLPVPVGADGLRQPVHAADLAGACAAVIDNPLTFGRIYELGGGERLRFAAMLRRTGTAQRGFVAPIPLPLIALRAFGYPRAAVARLREPLVADNTPAAHDFGFAPRAFLGADVLPAAASDAG